MARRRRRRTSSSQEIVLNDVDLLALILLHVPWRKLKVLKCVSKQWKSLITAPHFRNLLLLPLRASGLFIKRTPIRHDLHDKVYYVPLDDPHTPSPLRTLTFAHETFDPEHMYIWRSCNGLLLCSIRLSASRKRTRNCIYNPSTNHLAILPDEPLSDTRADFWYVGLAYDPSKSLHYKVIAFVSTASDVVGDFYIYSSETGTWRISVQSFRIAGDMCFMGGVYCNGCIHWLTTNRFGSVYGMVSYFNVDEGRVGTFPRPPIDEKSSSRRVYFGESGGHLHYSEACPYTILLGVYEVKSDYSEWFIKYRIDLSPVCNIFPKMACHNIRSITGVIYAFSVLSLVRRENFEEDSFLVLEIPGKVIRYNLVDRSFKVIWDFGVDLGLEKVGCWAAWATGKLVAYQCIETMSSV